MANLAFISKSLLTRIADAIRSKRGTSDPIKATDMPDLINEIETGVDISDTTLTNGDQLLSPVTAFDAKGNKITGSIETKSADDLTVSGAQVSVPAGYYSIPSTKSVATTGLGTPSISVSSSGMITSSITHTVSGYVSADTKTTTKQLSTQSAKTITPGTSAQTAVASGVYTTGAVTVSAVPTQTKSASPSTSTQTISPDTGKFLSKVTVNSISTQTKSVTPSSSTQYVVPDSGKYLTQVAVYGDSNLKSSNIKSGTSIFGIAGTLSSATIETISNVTISGRYMYIYPSGSISTLRGFALNFGGGGSYLNPDYSGDPLSGSSQYNSYGYSLGIVNSGTGGYACYTYAYAGTSLSESDIDQGELEVTCSSNQVTLYGNILRNISSSDLYTAFIVYS